VDFDLFLGVRNAERNGRKREKQAKNRPGGALGEVRKFPQEPARTRGNTLQQTKKIPNSDELGICIWWWIVDYLRTCYFDYLVIKSK